MADNLEKVALKVFRNIGNAMGAGALTNVFDDHKTWSPVVPADLHLAKLPAIAADGTGECWQCKTRLPFADLDIAGQAYVCRPCAVNTARVAAQQDAAGIDVDSVKIGRGRWWIFPLLAAGALAVTALIYVL